MTRTKYLTAAAVVLAALMAVSDVFGHPHFCKGCGRPSWCTHDDRGRPISCPECDA